MKNQELFDKTISILVTAYQKDTLLHDNCAACGIGNLISANCGFTVEHFKDKSFFIKGDNLYDATEWFKYFGSRKEVKQRFERNLLFMKKNVRYYFLISTHFEPKASKLVKSWISATGYNMIQLAKLENAFEFNDIAGDKVTKDQRMFSGLMGMVNCLMEIHEASKEEIKSAKELFVLID